MARLAIRLSDTLLHEVDASAKQLNITRAVYMRKALERMNSAVASQRRREWLMEASRKVREESMRVNAEFDVLADRDWTMHHR